MGTRRLRMQIQHDDKNKSTLLARYHRTKAATCSTRWERSISFLLYWAILATVVAWFFWSLRKSSLKPTMGTGLSTFACSQMMESTPEREETTLSEVTHQKPPVEIQRADDTNTPVYLRVHSAAAV
ncbi:hypothetical protein EYF80_030611 [Liparis tanakae]|uniref:Uncharacterized protein n=1 Tax=Liparis tanakae TaxID=230148 RepID=A0A4Z2H0N5_9TELE|nr:hypothetical protein EYF80_030611 [Liparis tanakae]